jgi:hypothetical protein
VSSFPIHTSFPGLINWQEEDHLFEDNYILGPKERDSYFPRVPMHFHKGSPEETNLGKKTKETEFSGFGDSPSCVTNQLYNHRKTT